VEVEAVRDAVRDHERRGPLGAELHDGGEPFRRRVAAQVANPDRGAAEGDGQVVVVADVDVDAAEHAGLRADRVPLHRLDPSRPLDPVELREDAALVAVRLQRHQRRPSREARRRLHASI
jgi:hypothetical protein